MDGERRTATFVGRQNELSLLQKALADALYKKQPRIVLIEGEVGLGKTTLVRQFLNLLEHEKEDSVWIAQAACDPSPSESAPFTEIAASLIKRNQGHRLSAEQVLNIFLRVAPAWLDIVSAGAATSIVKAVSKTLEVSSTEFSKKAYNQTNVSIQCKNLLQAISRQQPLVLFIDDLQWADSSTLDEIYHLARDLEDCHLLFIGAHRPVISLENDENARLFSDVHAEIRRRGAEFIDLQEGIDVAAYVAQRYPRNRFPQALIKRIQHQTEGHPLFVSELWSLWEQSGTVRYDIVDGEQVWTFTRVVDENLHLPTKLEEVLSRRLARLDADLKELLRIASVEGESFNAEVLRVMKKLDDAGIYESLDALKDNYHFIVGPTADELFDFYQFSHRYLRDYVYDGLPGGWKRKLHAQLGECLENLYRDPEKIASQLAIHFGEAGEGFKSAQYALMAAKFEFSRYAWSEGEYWCRFGLEKIKGLPLSVDTQQIKLSFLEISWSAFHACAHWPEAVARLEEAVQLAEDMKIEPYRRARMYVDLADVVDFTGHLDEAGAYLRTAKGILDDNNVPFSETTILLEAGLAYILDREGRTNEAIQTYQRIIAMALSASLSPAMQNALAFVYNVLGIAYGNCGKYDEAAQAYQKCLEFGLATGDFSFQTMPLLNLADDSTKRGEFMNGEQYATRGLEVAERIGDQDSIAYAHSILGSILLAQGCPTDALHEIGEAVRISESISANWNMPYMQGDMALANLALGHLGVALEQALAAVQSARDNDYQMELGYALDVLAQALMANGCFDEAERRFRESIEILGAGSYRYFEGQSQCHFASLLHALGRDAAALQMLDAACTTFEQLGLQYWLNKASGRMIDIRRRT